MARKTGITSNEFCILRPDGSYSDAELHEAILAEGDAEAATKGSRRLLADMGYSPDEIDSFLDRKSSASVDARPADAETSPPERKPADAVYLVSCVSEKWKEPCQARDLYVSEWFHKARAYVEATGRPWRILSARYGLLTPDQIVMPYEVTLNHMRRQARQEWAKHVIEQMDASLPQASSVVVLAGIRYREFLMHYLRQRFGTVNVPMEGLPIGKQLQFLGERLRHAGL